MIQIIACISTKLISEYSEVSIIQSNVWKKPHGKVKDQNTWKKPLSIYQGLLISFISKQRMDNTSLRFSLASKTKQKSYL